jgi:tol-pal system protein YbgF
MKSTAKSTTQNTTRNTARVLLLSCLLLAAVTGCAGLTKSHHEDSATPQPETDSQKIERLTREQGELKNSLASSTAKIEALETRLGSLNDKVDAARSTVDNMIASRRTNPQPVSQRASDVRGTSVTAPTAESDPEAGFTSDESIQRFRKAMVLFNSKNYSDAVLAFSAFIDQYPDHALAGSAQYYLAESYYHQNEYRLAQREYQRVLTTYDRSPRVADTLRKIADCEDRLQQSQAAAQHRELLMTLFPSSPAAAEARSDQRAAPTAEVAPRSERPAGSPGMEVPPTAGKSAEPARAGADMGLDNPPPTAPAASGPSETPPGKEQ